MYLTFMQVLQRPSLVYLSRPNRKVIIIEWSSVYLSRPNRKVIIIEWSVSLCFPRTTEMILKQYNFIINCQTKNSYLTFMLVLQRPKFAYTFLFRLPTKNQEHLYPFSLTPFPFSLFIFSLFLLIPLLTFLTTPSSFFSHFSFSYSSFFPRYISAIRAAVLMIYRYIKWRIPVS